MNFLADLDVSRVLLATFGGLGIGWVQAYLCDLVASMKYALIISLSLGFTPRLAVADTQLCSEAGAKMGADVDAAFSAIGTPSRKELAKGLKGCKGKAFSDAQFSNVYNAEFQAKSHNLEAPVCNESVAKMYRSGVVAADAKAKLTDEVTSLYRCKKTPSPEKIAAFKAGFADRIKEIEREEESAANAANTGADLRLKAAKTKDLEERKTFLQDEREARKLERAERNCHNENVTYDSHLDPSACPDDARPWNCIEKGIAVCIDPVTAWQKKTEYSKDLHQCVALPTGCSGS